MKTNQCLAFLLSFVFLIGCSSASDEQKEKTLVGPRPAPAAEVEADVPASERITLDNKGVGSIKNVELNPTIDLAMVERGAALFKTNCTACHKTTKRFIGPNPTDILKRRSPEWIMNMILDPKLMSEEDQCAKDLLVEFNGAAMANQNMTEEQARDILEFFRTLKS